MIEFGDQQRSVTDASTLLAVGAMLAVAPVLVWLARAELRRIRSHWAMLLLALRLALLATLAGLMADPRWVRSRRETVPGRILVAVDTSDSCRVTDLERLPLEKLRIVRALKLSADPELSGWIESLERGVVPAGERFAEAIAAHDALTRIDIARRLLAPEGGDLTALLKRHHGVEIVGFDGSLSALSSEPIANARGSTDLRIPLHRALELAAGEQSRLLGVVVLTDGQHNRGRAPDPAELASRGVPIFPVPLAPNDPPTDLALFEAKAQSTTVFQGSRVPVEIAVRATRWPSGPIRVTMEIPSSPPVGETVQHTGEDTVHRVVLSAKLDALGPQSIRVTVDSPSGKDRFTQNDARMLRVNVIKDRARLLLVDGEARWEFHYLHTALGRDERMAVRSVVFRQPRITGATDEEARRAGLPAQTLPTDAEALAGYDAIVLGDVEPEQLPPPDRARLEKYVAEGGTLVVAAGKRAMPLEYPADDPLARLLPIRSPHAWSEKLGAHLALTPEGERSWFLQLADKRGENPELWRRLPPHFWGVAGEPKAGAEVLATAEGQPAIVRQNYGFGRVLFLGIDSTWRWRYRVGVRHHHRFWGQVAQWAASDRLLPTANPAGTIRFGTREPAFKQGQPIEIVVRSSEGAPVLAPGTLRGAKIVPVAEGGTPVTVPLNEAEGRPRELIAKAEDLPSGKYRIELEIPAWASQLRDAEGKSLSAGFEVLPPEGEEYLELAANRPLLESLASATGGKVVELWETKELAEMLATRTAVVETRRAWPLRSSWWGFVPVLLLLCVEWGVRKIAGLP